MNCWNTETVRRIILDLAAKIKRKPFFGNAEDYRADQHLEKDLNFDSIDALDLSAHVSAFFHLMGSGVDNYLLTDLWVDHWVKKVIRARQREDKLISFWTSGTTGQEKRITHTTAFIKREISFLEKLLPKVSMIIPLVPSHAIYGFLFTAALPANKDVPVCFPSEVDWHNLPPDALIVGTPFRWSRLLQSIPELPLNCQGVSSTSFLPKPLFDNLSHRGVKLIEIYGSTETGGIGYRQNPQKGYQPFPYWTFPMDLAVVDLQNQQSFALSDFLDHQDDGTFFVKARTDKQIKVAGKLINLDLVTQKIVRFPGVSNCKIAAKRLMDRTILMANIRLTANTPDNQALCRKHIERMLIGPERPKEIYFEVN